MVKRTKVKLAIAVMAHPSRMPMVAVLLDSLGRDDVTVIVDSEEAGPWPTAQRCWKSCPDDATHMLILQDDVKVCRDFVAGAETVLSLRPQSPVAFYANHKVVERARQQGIPWAKIPRSHGLGGVWGQAQCLPSSYIGPFLRWWDNKPEGEFEDFDNPKHDDWILGQFLKKNKKDVWATAPSLVQHMCPSDSLIGYSNKNKVARWYIGDNRSALSVNWFRGL